MKKAFSSRAIAGMLTVLMTACGGGVQRTRSTDDPQEIVGTAEIVGSDVKKSHRARGILFVMHYPKIICAIVMCLITLLFSASSRAEGCSPLQVSLVATVQLVPKERDVCGARLNLLWGDNKAVWGVDAGLVNGAESIRGIEAGALLNRLKSAPESPATESWGLQMAGLVNSNARAGFAGIQTAGLVNDHDDASFMGIQLAGLVNNNDKAVYKGVQAALFSNQNYESEVTGIQAAMCNQSKKLNGVQIGLGNGVSTGECAVGMIVVPIALLAAAGGGRAPLPLYHDPHAHDGATVNGVQLGVFTNITEDIHGVQLGVFVNSVEDMRGLQAGMFNRASRSLSGVQIGVLNNEVGWKQVVNGIQLGVVGNFASDMTGFQFGSLNSAKNVNGLQIGFINVCRNLKGLQIGAMNIVTSRFPRSVFFAPVINVGF